MAGTLERGLLALEREGSFIEILIPFILVFTVVFAVLTKTKLFEQKKVNVMISLAIGLIVVFQHRLFPGRYSAVEIINRSIPSVAVIIIALLMLLVLVGILGGGANWGAGKAFSGIVAIIAVIAIVIIFATSAGFETTGGGGMSEETKTIIIALLVFGIIVWYVTREESGSGGAGEQFGKALESAGKFFSK